jgi:alpha 1,6-mannosyltransferase
MISLRRTVLIAFVIFALLYLFHSPSSSRSDLSTTQLDPKTNLPADLKANSAKFKQLTNSGSSSVQVSSGSNQKSFKDIASLPLRERLEYQFRYDLRTKFPAYIWQTWKYTPASGHFDEKFREPEASWTINHPNFVHEVVTDDVAVYLMRHLYAAVPEVVEAYQSMPMNILKADFFRYLILLARGGIYSDIDTVSLKSASSWVPENFPTESIGLVVGIEADPDRPDWHDWYPRRIQFCQWTIQAKPGHPVLREVVAAITEKTLSKKANHTLHTSQDEVMDFTGPAVWTDIIMKYMNDPEYFDMRESLGEVNWRNFTGIKTARRVGDVVVLPITSFSPGIGHSGAGEYDDPMAFVKHDFEGKSAFFPD